MVGNKPRLLILLDRLVIGGPAIDVVPLAYYLQQWFEVKLVYGAKKSDEIEAVHLFKRYPTVDAVALETKEHESPFMRFFRYYFSVKAIINSFKPHILHTQAVQCGVYGRLAGIITGVPIIVHTYHGHFFHSYFNGFISSAIVFLERALALKTDAIIAISLRQRTDFVDNYKIVPAQKISVIGLGIDDGLLGNMPVESRRSFREKYFLDEGSVAVGIIARIVPIKNFNLFVELVEEVLSKTNKRVVFFVIGDGPMKPSVQDRLTELSIPWYEGVDKKHAGCHVVFTSWLMDISPALVGLDVVILTSHNEGTALALAESQLAGRPVVATNVGGMGDTLVDKETGFLVNPTDAGEFADKLLLLVESRELRDRMGEAAKLFAKERFSKETEVRKLVGLYNRLLGEGVL